MRSILWLCVVASLGCGGAVVDVIEVDDEPIFEDGAGRYALLGGVPPAPLALPLPVPEEELEHYVVPVSDLPRPEEIVDFSGGVTNPYSDPAFQDGAGETDEALGDEDAAYVDADGAAEGLDTYAEETETFDEEVSASGSALVGGKAGHGRKGIGMLYLRTDQGWELCTGTLIRARVVITAAHCFYWGNSNRTSNWGYFITQRFNSSTGVMETTGEFMVTNFRSFSRRWEDLSRDIALARLHKKVPGSIAKPIKLETRKVKGPRKLETWGYGCTKRGTQKGQEFKRYIKWKGPKKTTGRLCEGDSGGPTLAPASGYGVFQINSAYDSVTGRDIYAKVYPIAAGLKKQSYQWR